MVYFLVRPRSSCDALSEITLQLVEFSSAVVVLLPDGCPLKGGAIPEGKATPLDCESLGCMLPDTHLSKLPAGSLLPTGGVFSLM